MAFKHGRLAAVWLGAFDLSSYFTDMTLAMEVATADTTGFQSLWKTAIAGQKDAKVDLKGMYDPLITSLPALVGTADAVLTVFPTYVAIGDPARLLLAETASYVEASPVGGLVGCNLGVKSGAPVGVGQVLHLWGADTNTTTGPDKDDAAASSTGWVAHLHVSAVTGGTWVVKLQDAATTDWADVTGGAFNSASGATSQRLISASATTALRRHVRYVATRTGGVAGDSITFGLAYARNV